MSVDAQSPDVSGMIATYLPNLRRFARALSGSQSGGDAYAAATLQAILEDRSLFDGALHPKVALFRVFDRVWGSSGAVIEAPGEAEANPRAAAAQARLRALTPKAREALLLRALEDLSDGAIAEVMGLTPETAAELADIGAREIASDLRSRVMIIEDEALIAMDLQTIVEDMGHSVTGIAPTHRKALALVESEMPDLVLADVHLADGSSGIEAVTEILERFGRTPVIFITAYPERLLTGTRPEPTYLLTKPFKVHQVKTAIEQALFFQNAALVSL
ncbi:MAG: response regulator [Pseudomonadota bacterium]